MYKYIYVISYANLDKLYLHDGRMVYSALFLKWRGQVPILRSIQYVTFKYGDFQKASRISLREPSLSINSIEILLPCWSSEILLPCLSSEMVTLLVVRNMVTLLVVWNMVTLLLVWNMVTLLLVWNIATLLVVQKIASLPVVWKYCFLAGLVVWNSYMSIGILSSSNKFNQIKSNGKTFF